MTIPIWFVLLLLVIFTVLTIQYLIKRPLYKGPVSDHFNGTYFYYKEYQHSWKAMLKWALEMKIVKWPKWIHDPPQPKPEALVKEGEMKITYINHGTVLIQMDGINILTDPIWSKRAGPFGKIGPKRVRNPGVKFEELPKIDLILISHDHFDHLSLDTLKKIEQRYQPQILCGLGVQSLLNPKDFSQVKEMDWWQEYILDPSQIKITFVPAKHYSGRTMIGNNRTLWGGFVIEGQKGKIYHAGDTGYDELLNLIKGKFGEFRVTLLPIGSYEKRWYMQTQHMDPEDAVKVHMLLDSKQSIGYHYATFNEHPEQSIDAHEKDLEEALKKYNIPPTKFWVLAFGEGRYIP